MNAGAYNLRCVLLIAGRPSGFDRAAQARATDAEDRTGLSWRCWLTTDELSAELAWRVSAPTASPAAQPSVIARSLRIGERAPWTDPAGL